VIEGGFHGFVGASKQVSAMLFPELGRNPGFDAILKSISMRHQIKGSFAFVSLTHT
jgi:hypothetical protein